VRNWKIRAPRLRKGKRSEKGYALISVIFAASLVLLTLLMVMSIAQLGTKILVLQLTYQGQALNTANAGLIEGLDWYLRQSSTVTAFAPVRNMAASPLPIDDTDVVTNPVSINRDFLISAPGRIWGHYELTRGAAGATAGVQDISDNRTGVAADGTIWQLESTGVIYVKNGNVAYNVSPNQVLARRTVRTEISRLRIQVPSAAISLNGGTAIFGMTADKVRVVGGPGAFGVQINPVGGVVAKAPAATLSGNNGSQSPVDPILTTNSVFGLQSASDIAAIANINVTNESNLPSPLPGMQLIFINRGAGNTVTFGPGNPLRGSGILYINGNLSVSGLSDWNGIIYVTGSYTQGDPATVHGTVLVASTAGASIQGTSDYAEIYYDPYIITQIKQQIGRYRMSRRPYIPCLANDPLCTSRLSGNRDTGY